MITSEQLVRARLAILLMATELKNIARACKLARVSRSQFYAMKKAYETHGREGLVPRPRRKPQMPNRTPAAIEEQILLKTHANPAISYIRLAEQMKVGGCSVTPTMVRYVWKRHGLSTIPARLQWVKGQNGRFGGVKGNGASKRLLEVDPGTYVPTTSTVPISPTPVTDAV